jgi:hypothetical protein
MKEENSTLYRHISTAQKFNTGQLELPLKNPDADKQLELGLGYANSTNRTPVGPKSEPLVNRPAMPVPN